VLGIATIALAFLQVRSGFGEWSMRTGQPDLSHWCHDLLAAWAVVRVLSLRRSLELR
jgi:hypothetical protein